MFGDDARHQREEQQQLAAPTHKQALGPQQQRTRGSGQKYHLILLGMEYFGHTHHHAHVPVDLAVRVVQLQLDVVCDA